MKEKDVLTTKLDDVESKAQNLAISQQKLRKSLKDAIYKGEYEGGVVYTQI